jgi:hypothetical protein
LIVILFPESSITLAASRPIAVEDLSAKVRTMAAFGGTVEAVPFAGALGSTDKAPVTS